MSIHIFDDEYTGPRYTYGCTIRPAARFNIPEGYICDSQREHPNFRSFGTVDYPMALTPEQLNHYDMVLVKQPEAMTDQQITKIAQGINGSVSGPELRDRLAWICGLPDNDMVSEAGLRISRIAQAVWDARQAN